MLKSLVVLFLFVCMGCSTFTGNGKDRSTASQTITPSVGKIVIERLGIKPGKAATEEASSLVQPIFHMLYSDQHSKKKDSLYIYSSLGDLCEINKELLLKKGVSALSVINFLINPLAKTTCTLNNDESGEAIDFSLEYLVFKN